MRLSSVWNLKSSQSWRWKRKISHELINGEAVGIWTSLILAILVILCVCECVYEILMIKLFKIFIFTLLETRKVGMESNKSEGKTF